MAAQGPLGPGTLADDATVGTIAWTNPGNAAASDNTYATVLLPFAGGVADESHYIKATNFGFAIPANGVIDGIQVEFEASKDVAGQTAKDKKLRIVKGGVIGATDRAPATNVSTSDVVYTQTGASPSTELWGQAWTPADINAATFGAALSVTDATTNTVDVTYKLDQIRITVFYHVPGKGSLAALGVG